MTRYVLLMCALCTLEAPVTFAESYDPQLYQELRWRMIGPYRGGRTVGAAGVPSRPNVFYIGVNNGGVWKTTDFGHTWKPIFDDQPTGSIGTLAIAPSNPEIIYVGSGEGLQRPDLSTGDGVYKSLDGGKTWTHLGLSDGQQIPAILVDPRDPNRVFVAVLGHPYGANKERGIFRSLDGGKTWTKVLYKDENTGGMALAFDPADANSVYAVLWAARQGPWENGAWQGSGSGLFKSLDGGATWRQLTRGLPTFEQGLGRIGIAVAPSDRRRLFALADARVRGGLYRSDDAGETWRHINGDQRLWGRGSDFAELKVDPKNPDTVYVANIAFYRSTDAGASFVCARGAPGGDDYHTIWINPDHPQIMLLATDQGATITVNGGETWSSWYNQPTAQFYHVITDNQFPYWVYGGQQESGSAGVSSRGRDGMITFRDWHTVGVEEYGYVAPDPLDPNIIYGGKITRFDRRTGQVQNVAPEALRSGKYRFLRTAPVIFSPVDPHMLFLGANVLFRTRTGGQSWEIVSPDLSREKPVVPESIGIFRTPDLARQPRRGVIYTVAPSYKNAEVIWAGTDDGLIQVTRDGGKNWTNVTPPAINAWSKISIIDSGRFDAGSTYVAVNRIRLDDQRPHIYRTHDYGKSWKEIVHGLPDNAPVNSIREDPVRRGLLFAGTERAIHVSFDDGENWQSLRLNMPATSMRDLVVHNDDIVVGTHGRSFWILDDITPLRQLTSKVAAAPMHLFKPQVAYRVRRSVATDTPLPPEEPSGQNPPDGAIINYWLREADESTVVLEIFDSADRLVRRFTSKDPLDQNANRELNFGTYWLRPPRPLAATSGMHRFTWDLHYPPPAGARRSYPISAVFRDTPSEPVGPAVLPGTYTVKLTAAGVNITQPLVVKMDPRVPTPPDGIRRQFTIAMHCWEGGNKIQQVAQQVQDLRKQLRAKTEQAPAQLKASIEKLEQKLNSLVGASGGGRRRGGSGGAGLMQLQGQFNALMHLVEGADATPTSQAVAADETLQKSLTEHLTRWQNIRESDLKTLSEELRKAGLPSISLDKS